MTSPRLRGLAALALVAIGAASLAACTPSGSTDGSGPTEQSVAVLEQFFTHLENGETTNAAALTSIDFPAEYLDEAFYAASAALPSDARVIETTGSDEHTVTATVEYVLDDPEKPVTSTFKVRNDDGDRTVSWKKEYLAVINAGSPGRLVLNGDMEFAVSPDAGKAFLLPALYAFTYVDPTGITHLDTDGTDEFTVPWPMDGEPSASGLPDAINLSSSVVSTTATVAPEIIDAVESQITELTTACVAEAMAGPSCPAAVLEYSKPLIDPSTVEWFQDPNYGIEIADGRVEYSMGFSVRADGEVYPVPAVYEGTVTRDADGAVVYTRE